MTSSDGLELAVRCFGPPEAVPVLLVHGFPDDGSVWDAVAESLARDYRVVVPDVRGSGDSGRPRRLRDYRLDQLADDLVSVVVQVAPGRRVHVVGHDWGAVQSWHLATHGRAGSLLRSMTSISGPNLDAVPDWARSRLRAGRVGWADVASLWKSPLYMGPLATPGIGTVMCRAGLVDLCLSAAARWERDPADPRAAAVADGSPQRTPRPGRARANHDAVRIYGANLPRLLRRGRSARRPVEVPVQVLAPRRDIFIPARTQRNTPGEVAENVDHRSLPGGHWAPAHHPAVVAGAVTGFLATVDTADARVDGPAEQITPDRGGS